MYGKVAPFMDYSATYASITIQASQIKPAVKSLHNITNKTTTCYFLVYQFYMVYIFYLFIF